MREVNELLNVDAPAWPLLLQELSGTDVPVEVLPGDAGTGRASLLQLQVSARSNLGGIVLNCGGLLVDHGWLRIFGSPNGADAERLPGLVEINAMPSAFDPAWRPGAGLVVAHDVLGGVFALNGSDPQEAGRPGGPGEIVYFAPDALGWEALGAGHSARSRTTGFSPFAGVVPERISTQSVAASVGVGRKQGAPGAMTSAGCPA
ncbi:DUF2625 family protein [Streptomyces sp. NPDC057521]|uniref:DUF2625 family protein n=1 Tax=Streptomyces sp. NPDC057521 TaxID=3346156 RepID=UPI00367BED21